MATPINDSTDRRAQTRRKHIRAVVEWPTTVATTEGSYQGIAANISRGGALIYLSQELTIGEHVRLAFEIPEYQDAIVAKGEILRVFILKQADELEFTHGAALQFTEISDENLRYFTGDIAPEWKAGYIDSGPVITDSEPEKPRRKTSILPWVLVIFLLIPLSYFIYDTTQRKFDDKILVSEIERKLLTIESDISSIQNSLGSLTPLESQIKNIQIEVTNLAKKLPDATSSETLTQQQIENLQKEVANLTQKIPDAMSIEELTQQIIRQNSQIENLNKKIDHFDGNNLKSSENDQQKVEEKQYYIVQKDDNLYRISKKYKMTTKELRELNGIGPAETIFPGQKLILE